MRDDVEERPAPVAFTPSAESIEAAVLACVEGCAYCRGAGCMECWTPERDAAAQIRRLRGVTHG